MTKKYGSIFRVLNVYCEKRDRGYILEFLLIGESKIKIVLTRAEADEMNLVSQNISDADNRRAFWKLIGVAKERVGFDPAGDKLLIQLYPMKEGVELFVTKLGILPDSSARLVARSDKISLLSKKRSLYAFDTLDDLVSAARSVRAVSGDTNIESDAYMANEKYYLSIEEYGKGGEVVEFPCILEFATPITAELSAYIVEHSECLATGDAILKFSLL
jgi:negative regulator of genetic competence, sporulation and motility